MTDISHAIRCSNCTSLVEHHRNWPEMCSAAPTIGALLDAIEASKRLRDIEAAARALVESDPQCIETGDRLEGYVVDTEWWQALVRAVRGEDAP